MQVQHMQHSAVWRFDRSIEQGAVPFDDDCLGPGGVLARRPPGPALDKIVMNLT